MEKLQRFKDFFFDDFVRYVLHRDPNDQLKGDEQELFDKYISETPAMEDMSIDFIIGFYHGLNEKAGLTTKL